MKAFNCAGPVLAEKDGRRIIDCRRCGYAHVFPMYSAAELEDFYAKHYAESTPSHLFRLKVHNVSRFVAKGRVLDLGCWSGMQLEHFKAAGWRCSGLELNENAARQAISKGFEVFQMSFEAFFQRHGRRRWDVVNAAYVLEHIPDPVGFMETIGRHVKPAGVLVIEVPNEFNPPQLVYVDQHKVDPYWIALPDHVNYFTRKGIASLIRRSGWKILHAECSFPMEMFLLMGDDYRRSPEIGPICFQKVVAMENAIMNQDVQLLSDIYAQLYRRGVGRSLIYYLARR